MPKKSVDRLKLPHVKFRKFPQAPTSKLTVVRVERWLFGKGPNGGLVTTYEEMVSGRARTYASSVRGNEVALKALFLLGVISKETYQRAERERQEREKQRSRHYDAESILRDAKDLGMKLTPSQRKFLEAERDKPWSR